MPPERLSGTAHENAFLACCARVQQVDTQARRAHDFCSDQLWQIARQNGLLSEATTVDLADHCDTCALSIIGFFVNRAIETTMKANLKSELETLLTVETEMLKNWYSVQKAHAMAVANSPSVRKAVTELISEQLTVKTKSLDELQQAQLAIAREVAHFLDANDHEGFIITDRRNKIVATSTDDSSGMHDAQSYAGFLSRVYQGEAVVSTPVASAIPIKDENGAMRTGMPTMYAAAPIQDENLQVVGALALRIQPEKEFTRILQLGRMDNPVRRMPLTDWA